MFRRVSESRGLRTVLMVIRLQNGAFLSLQHFELYRVNWKGAAYHSKVCRDIPLKCVFADHLLSLSELLCVRAFELLWSELPLIVPQEEKCIQEKMICLIRDMNKRSHMLSVCFFLHCSQLASNCGIKGVFVLLFLYTLDVVMLWGFLLLVCGSPGCFLKSLFMLFNSFFVELATSHSQLGPFPILSQFGALSWSRWCTPDRGVFKELSWQFDLFNVIICFLWPISRFSKYSMCICVCEAILRLTPG